MAEYFTIRTDTGLTATFPYTTWERYLSWNEGSNRGGHVVTFVTTLYDAKNLNHAIVKGRKILRWYNV